MEHVAGRGIEAFRHKADIVRKSAEAAGRDPGSIVMTVTREAPLPTTSDESARWRDELRPFIEAGVSHVLGDFGHVTSTEPVMRFVEEVIAPLRARGWTARPATGQRSGVRRSSFSRTAPSRDRRQPVQRVRHADADRDAAALRRQPGRHGRRRRAGQRRARRSRRCCCGRWLVGSPTSGGDGRWCWLARPATGSPAWSTCSQAQSRALIAGRVLHGFGLANYTTAANAYLADIAPPRRRAEAIGWYAVAMDVGLVVGPAIGFFIAEGFGFQTLFFLSGGLAFTAFAVSTLARERRQRPPGPRATWSLRTGIVAIDALPVAWTAACLGMGFGPVAAFISIFATERAAAQNRIEHQGDVALLHARWEAKERRDEAEPAPAPFTFRGVMMRDAVLGASPIRIRPGG